MPPATPPLPEPPSPPVALTTPASPAGSAAHAAAAGPAPGAEVLRRLEGAVLARLDEAQACIGACSVAQDAARCRELLATASSCLGVLQAVQGLKHQL